MNQFGLWHIYTWKCHKETPCVDILSKQKCHFFLLQNWRTGGWNRSCLGGLVPVPGERVWVNIVLILCTHVCKWKNDTCWNYSKNGVGIKENDGMNSSKIYLIYFKNFCKCHNVPPPSTTKKKIKFYPSIKAHLTCNIHYKASS
jgi:hypothetical protein